MNKRQLVQYLETFDEEDEVVIYDSSHIDGDPLSLELPITGVFGMKRDDKTYCVIKLG